jgi:hypothetical protein
MAVLMVGGWLGGWDVEGLVCGGFGRRAGIYRVVDWIIDRL